MFSVQNWASDRYNCVIIVSSPGKLGVRAHGRLIWFKLILCTILACLGISPNLRQIWSALRAERNNPNSSFFILLFSLCFPRHSLSQYLTLYFSYKIKIKVEFEVVGVIEFFVKIWKKTQLCILFMIQNS